MPARRAGPETWSGFQNQGKGFGLGFRVRVSGTRSNLWLGAEESVPGSAKSRAKGRAKGRV